MRTSAPAGGSDDCYVYVYIDPRNHEEFYYGKGQRGRKDAHLGARGDSEKANRIRDIQNAGLEPIIRVVARGLNEHDALLVEKTLLWKLGGQLTNLASGHYRKNFRSKNTLHFELPGFDFRNGVYYFNCGEGPNRNWDDFRRYGFISAGGGIRWRVAICGFHPGDVVVAYLKGYGYVGIGTILEKAKPAREVLLRKRPILSLKMTVDNGGFAHRLDDDDLCEHACPVKWKVAVPRDKARFERNVGLFTTQLVRASLDRQAATLAFLKREFRVDPSRLVKRKAANRSAT